MTGEQGNADQHCQKDNCSTHHENLAPGLRKNIAHVPHACFLEDTCTKLPSVNERPSSFLRNTCFLLESNSCSGYLNWEEASCLKGLSSPVHGIRMKYILSIGVRGHPPHKLDTSRMTLAAASWIRTGRHSRLRSVRNCNCGNARLRALEPVCKTCRVAA